ncbi:hypothetical protein ACLKA6_010454 [Drosophila palustris]
MIYVSMKRPRYYQQLQQYVRPSQQPQQQPLQERVPTLLRIQQEEQEEQVAIQRANAAALRQASRQPAVRLSEMAINEYRRRFRHGLISRENLQELIREQPAGIQQLILPPLNATQQTTQREQTALAPAITQQLTPPQRHAIDLQYITETHQPIRNNNSTMNAQKRSPFLRIQQLRQHINT